MTKLSALLAASALLALTACSSSTEDEDASSEADDFAARINANKQAEAAGPAVATPTVAPPRDGGASDVFVAGTATDPNSACNANLFGRFLGQQPSAQVRAEIMETAVNIPEVRFITPGSSFIRPDPTHPRLNVMIAVDGVIRDIRCG